MTDERFWALIDEARAGSSASVPPKQLRKLLERLGDQDILEFGHKFYENLCDLNQWNLWAAGHVISGGMGDDSFHYFRSWIIGKGKIAFDLAMQNPDALAPFIDDDEVDNELLEYVALEVLEERGIKEDPRERANRSPDDEPKGEPFDEETVASRFPKIASRVG
jgi:hypothetical protein